MYSRYCLESSKSDKNPADEEVATENSTESLEAAAQPSQEALSDWGNVTVVQVKPMNKASGVTKRPLAAHPSRRSSNTVNLPQKVQNKASSGASDVTSRLLADDPSRRLTVKEIAELEDMPELSRIARHVLATRARRRNSTMVRVQQGQNEVHSGATSSVTSRPLGAHPNRRRSTIVSVQERDPNHYYSRNAREDMTEEDTKFGERVIAWN